MCETSDMNALSRYRTDHGLKQQELAEKIGTSPGYLNDLESGRRKPSPALANKIERLVGIPREDLLPDVFGPAPKAERAA